MDFESLINAARASGEAHSANADYTLVPLGYQLEDLQNYHLKPRRTAITVKASAVATLIDYFNEFKGDNSVIFGDPAEFFVSGVIDYHAQNTPAFLAHRINYAAPKSLEWKTWRGASGRKMSQGEFATFIEENQIDIRKPDGAAVLETSRNLRANIKVEFVSGISLADGSRQLTYNETIEGTTKKGSLKIPSEFTLGIPVFFGGDNYEARARLRFRIESGHLAIWFDLYRPEYIEQDAFNKIIDQVESKTKTQVWLGSI